MDKDLSPASPEDRLAARIADLRRAKGWSFSELSKELERNRCPIDRSSLQKIEKGVPRRKINVNELVAFSNVFGLPVSALLEDGAGIERELAWVNLLHAESLAEIYMVAKREYTELIRRLQKLVENDEEFEAQLWERFNRNRQDIAEKAEQRAHEDGLPADAHLSRLDYDPNTPITRTARDILRFDLDWGNESDGE